ncbi:MAG: hypothetical protein K6A96_01925 [Prevotella sp.]|nr:hypothetical protein [Prevotella sp.]
MPTSVCVSGMTQTWQVNDSATLHLIRSFLKAGVMEEGLVHATEERVPQGGCLSPILSNIYLDKLDKELESRGPSRTKARKGLFYTKSQCAVVSAVARSSSARLLPKGRKNSTLYTLHSTL